MDGLSSPGVFWRVSEVLCTPQFLGLGHMAKARIQGRKSGTLHLNRKDSSD